MDRKKIKKMLDDIEKEVQAWAEDCPNPEMHFWAHCTLPEWFHMIEEEMTPWHHRLWFWLCWQWRRVRTWPNLDDEIPF